MTSKEIVKDIMNKKEITNAQMASALNVTQAALWARLDPTKSDNTTVKKLNAMLRILGYELVIVPRTKASRIDGAYVVEDSDV